MNRASRLDTAPGEAASLVKPARDRATVLVVEDEVLVRIMVAEELRNCGYVVIEAANADEALAVLHSKVPIGLLLTDVRMPGAIDGLELARRVRSERPEMKVVIASGQMPDVASSVPVDGFFNKPYDFKGLIAHIEALIAPEAID